MAEIGQIDSMDSLAHWAKDALPRKNRLVLTDADTLEATFARRLSEVGSTSDASAVEEEAEAVPTDDLASRNVTVDARTRSSDDLSKRKRQRIRTSRQTNESPKIDKSVLAFPEPRRVRDKEHLKFVGRQPCLICGRAPSDAHHLRFAQLRALGRKVSDEFTVPLCRGHHREVHRTGNEPGFWDRAEIDALKIAHGLWQQSRRPADPTSKSAADLHN